MQHHFRAFSFVDRIRAFTPGQHIRGAYQVPVGADVFPLSLVAEAVGQLAAWAAMATVGFTHRPVAGLAGRIELGTGPQPGHWLELEAELESVDAEAVAYAGRARAGGEPVIRLEHCVGPMLPVVEFDDPQALRERFELLRGGGATPGLFGGLPELTPVPAESEPGRLMRATLAVPAQAPFFADHFPRRPVFPGSLLMHANLQLAAALAAQLPPPAAGGRWTVGFVADMKLRSFIPPGSVLALEVRLDEL
ncbi:MAG TPA: hypothetical protein VNO52_09445, partial [Methylomirabilota bacterium]|nr:hypothetical protein [Methylomirabilota bacterium]